MLVDDDIDIRRAAVKKIILARRNPPQGEVRKFLKPTREQINEDATEYHNILNWELVQCMNKK